MVDSDSPPLGLDGLRTKLEAVDREILELIDVRQRLSRKVGAFKRQHGRAIRHFDRERDVVERAKATAAQLGISPKLAEAVALLLIEHSLTVQEEDNVADKGSGNGKRVLIIGGTGHMGRWIGTFLQTQGYEIEVADPTRPDWDVLWRADWRQGALDHDVIAIATPLRTTASILAELATDPPPGLIFDVASLKSPLRDALKALAEAGATVTSLHPMFGPDTRMLSGRHVVFVDVGHPEAVTLAKKLFEPTMAVQVDMTVDDHDRLIAYVLGLSHALNIAFFTALAESGEAAPRLAKMSSTTFDNQLSVSSAVANENPDLYFEIQRLNDYGTESLSALLYAVERIRSVVRAGDKNEFRKLMEQGRAYLAGRNASGEPQ